MAESLDKYSKPVKIEKTILATLLWNNPRDSKKGRLFVPLYDERFPFLNNFIVKYIYTSIFLEKNNISGNHYHLKKREILVPLQGDFEIHLEDINTKEKEILLINS